MFGLFVLVFYMVLTSVHVLAGLYMCVYIHWTDKSFNDQLQHFCLGLTCFLRLLQLRAIFFVKFNCTDFYLSSDVFSAHKTFFFSYYLRLTGWNQRKEGFELIDKFITRDVRIIMARELTWHVYDSRHAPGSWREHCSSELMSATCLQNGLQSLETLISLGTQH